MDDCTLGNSRCQYFDAGGEEPNNNINGGTFNLYGASGTDDKKRITDAMALLSSCAERGAPHDGATREGVFKCHEQTRSAIIDYIQKWGQSKEPDARPLMWVYGPAGSGKTTIMRTVAEIFDQDKRLAASFFFSRLPSAQLRKRDNFVITLAHQLSLCIPALQEPLAHALSDLSLLKKSLSKQLDTLIVGPLNGLHPDQIGNRYIFMVDGLDECEGDAAQQDILNILERCFRQSRHQIRILIASQSLSHIQAFFSQRSIGVITQTMPLDIDYRANEDIFNHLMVEFGRIRDEHPSRCGLPSDWPSPSDVAILVKRASGQFIYASVVMKFIADQGRHPDESLQTVIRLQVDGEAKPYEALDAIYAQVLSSIEPQDVEFIFTLMGCMILDNGPFPKAIQTGSTTAVDLLFGLQPRSTDAQINRMSLLILNYKSNQRSALHYVPGSQTDGLLFAHPSFPEYLLDQSRSKDFFLNISKIHCSLAYSCFETYSLRPGHTSREHPGARPYLRELIGHCQQAEWTPELRNAVLTFNVQTAFTPIPEWIKEQKQHISWEGIRDWVLFVTWCEYYHHISSTDAEHVRDCLHNMIRSLCSKLSSSHNIDMKILAVLLTLYRSIDIADCWSELYERLGHAEGRALMYFRNSLLIGENDDVCGASHIWLCKTLAPDLEMDGSFFADSNAYTDLALLYVQSRMHPRDKTMRGIGSRAASTRALTQKLAVMLSKSAPSEELATALTQDFLQISRLTYEREQEEKKEVITAMLIYLFECNTPYISHHHHPADFDPHAKVCAICLLFDPYKEECADIELSQDPTGASCDRFVGTTEEDSAALVNPVQHPIPGVRFLWLRMWILWLANTMTRLFPVVT